MPVGEMGRELAGAGRALREGKKEGSTAGSFSECYAT